MADEIRIPVSADTSRMEADISNAARRAQVTIAPTINSRGLDSISRPLGKITGQADEFTKSMEAANARVLAFGASVGVLNAVAKAFSTIVSSSIEVERTLSEIAVASGEAGKNLDSLGKGIFNIAKLTGTSFKDAANAALEFSRQGAGVEESLKRAQAALVLTRTTGLDAAESVKGLTAAVSSFNDVGLDYERVVNKLASVDTKFAVSSRDLIEGITRSASVAQEAGVSFDELTALITTLQEKTARGGAVIGNALKTIFTRVQSTENLDLLRSLGIAVNDVEGNILPATTIIKKLAAEIQNLDDATRKSVLIKIGGGFQIDKLSAVLKDVADANGVFARSLTESQNAANQAFTKVEQLGKTTGAAFDKLVLSSNELASNIGKIGVSGNLKNILGGLDSAVQSINKAITGGDEGETIGNKLAQGIIAGIGNVLSGPGLLLAVGVGLKLLTNFGKFLAESVQTQLGVNTAKKEQASLEKDIFAALTKNQDVQSVILSLEGNKAKQAEYILGIYKQQAAFLEKMSSISKTIAPVLYEGGIRSSMEGVKDVKKAAGGYMPIGSAIADERKNSPAGSRIIVDNNFPMGGGKRGTMVYNSNEKRIPNFAGTGGDAIIPNYRPRSAARGYIPNFANNNPAVNTTGLPELALDASEYGIAGLTIGGKEDVIRARFKRENLLKPVEGDPLLTKIFSKYGAFGIENVPVGNVYRRENENLSSIQAKEKDIKKLFRDRANATLSPKIGEFIQQELAYLQIKPTESMDYALRAGEKLDFINDQTAGKFFEIMLNAANMDFLDDNWGQFTSDSGADERSSFDIYNLKPELAKQYGLKEKDYSYVEVKASKSDLAKDLTRKTTNELLKNGTLRQKFLSKYGKGISAANGYIPNFAKREVYPQKASVGSFKNLKNAQSADPSDSFEALIKVIRLQKDEEGASQDIDFFRKKSDKIAKELIGNSTDGYKNKQIYDKYIGEWKAAGADSSALQNIKTLYDKYEPGKENTNIFRPFKFRIQGLLGEIAASKFLRRKILNKNSYFDLENNTEVKTTKKQSLLEVLKKGINTYLQRNKTKDGIAKNYPLGNVDLVVPNDTLITASSGYVPNFADSAVMDAIQREKLESGLPLSAISVVKDGKLKNSQNPNGLAVINKRDEPNGKIPNFAAGDEKFEIIFQRLEKLFNESGDGFAKAVENAAKRLDTSVESISDTLLKRLEGKDGAGTSNTDTQKENTTATKENTKEKEKEKKTVQDSLYNLLKWQTVLSFTSGVISKFGDQAGKVGDALSSFGTTILSTKEGFDAIKQLAIGNKSFSEAFRRASRTANVSAGRTAQTGGGIVDQGLAAAGGFVKGGGLRAVGAAAGVAGVGVIAAIEAFNGLDKTIEAFNGSVEKSSTTLSSLNEMQQKYGVTLSESQKNLVTLSSSAVGSGNALSGFLNKLGIAALNPFSTKTEDLVQKNFGSTGLSTEANKSLFSAIASVRTPQIELAMKEAEKAKSGKRLEEVKIPSALLIEEVQKQSVSILEEARRNVSAKMQEEASQIIVPTKTESKTISVLNDTGSGKGKMASQKTINVQVEDKETDQYKKRKEILDKIEAQELDIADVLREVDSILEKQSDKSKDLVARAKEYQESFLYSTKYLQSQLNYSSELLKIQNSISSSEQTLLRFRKENVQTFEAEKMLIDYKLQKLEAEKNLRSDIQQSILDTAKQEINQFISNRGQKLNEQEAQNVLNLYKQLANVPATSAAVGDVFNKFVQDLLKVGPENEKWIENLNSIGKSLQLTVDLQKERFAVSQQELQTQTLLNAINAKISNEYDAQKQFLNNKISIQQKGLEIAKEELDISRQIRDTKFERSLVGLSPRRQELKRIERGLSGIELSDKLTDIKTRRAQAGLGVRSNLMQAILEQDKTIEPMSLEGMSQSELQKKFLDTFNIKGSKLDETIDKIQGEVLNSFPSSVSQAGDIFKTKAQEAGEALAKSLGVDVIKQPTTFGGGYPQGINKNKEDEEKENVEKQAEATAPRQVPNDVQTRLDEAKRREQANKEARAQTALQEILSKGALPKNLEQGAREDAATQVAKLLDQQEKLTTFRGGFRASLQEIDDEIDGFKNKLGRQIPTDFRNGLVDAMRALSDPNATTSLKERLLGVANAFLTRINDAFMTNFANKITQGIFGSGQFGESKGIFSMSAGGEISRGSGYKDDVPAMLMKGEYVVKKSAVSKYGKDFFDKLNRGKVQGFANGGIVGFEEANRQDLTINPNNYTPYGQVTSGNLIFDQTGKVSGISNYTGREENREDAIKRAQSDFYARGAQTGMGGFFTPGTYGQGAIMGQRNLLSFATQGTTGTQFDVMRGGGGAASVDIAGGSANLSLFALRNQDNLRNVEYSSAQQKALDLYFGQMGAEKEKFQKEEQARKEIEEFKKRIDEEAKRQRKALMTQVISTFAMAAISAGVSSFSKGVGSARQAAELKGEKLSTLGALKGGFTGGTFNGETRGGLFNIFGSGFKDFSVVGTDIAKVKGAGLAKFDSATGKYGLMDASEFGVRYGTLNNLGRLGYDQFGTPTIGGGLSGGMGSSLSKLNPMNWFKSSRSPVGSVTSGSDGLNFGNMGFGDRSSNLSDLNEAYYYDDAEVTLNGKTFNSPVNYVNGKPRVLIKNKWTEISDRDNFKIRLAAGGYVPGNGMGDNVPAMLNGGEFVISKQAAQNIGYNNLQAMNAGAGGAGSNEIATRIEIKLQELVEKVAGVGTINITVESGKGGGENQGGSNENASNQESQNRDLARKIKDVVINVIREEKRLGGMLR